MSHLTHSASRDDNVNESSDVYRSEIHKLGDFGFQAGRWNPTLWRALATLKSHWPRA